MNKLHDDWRGSFGSLRVPFEYKSIVFGFLGVAVFLAGVCGVDQVAKGFKEERKEKETEEQYISRVSPEREIDLTVFEQFVLNQMPAKQKKVLNLAQEETLKSDTGYLSTAGPLAFWLSLRSAPWPVQTITLVWFLIVWALVGGAVTRVTAMRVAKDESISFKEAFQYVWNNKLTYLLTPVAVMAFMLVFLVCNLVAGLVGMIPVAGPFLYLILFILVLLSTLFITLLGIGLVFGFNMISASISTEGGDGLQAVINVFNYVYARPWQYMHYTGLIVVSVLFIHWIGNVFVDLSLDSTLVSSDARDYEFVYEKADDAEPYQVKITARDGKETIYWKNKDRYSDALSKWNKDIEAKEEEIGKKKKELDEQENEDRKKAIQVDIDVLETDLEELNEKAPKEYEVSLSTARDYVEGTPIRFTGKEVEGHGPTLALSDIDSTPIYCAAAVLCLVIGFLKLFVLGYAASYVLAGSTTMYFLLRRDVDGTDFEEIVEKDDSIEFGEEVFEEKKADGAAPAAAPAAPTADKKDEAKPEEVKKDEAKPEEAKPDEAKPDEAKKDEVKSDEAKKDESPAPDADKKDEASGDEKKDEEKKDS